MNNGVAFAADHDRRHELKAVGIYSKGKWSFSAAWVFASGKAYTAPESQYFLEMLNRTVRPGFHLDGDWDLEIREIGEMVATKSKWPRPA